MDTMEKSVMYNRRKEFRHDAILVKLLLEEEDVDAVSTSESASSTCASSEARSFTGAGSKEVASLSVELFMIQCRDFPQVTVFQ